MRENGFEENERAFDRPLSVGGIQKIVAEDLIEGREPPLDAILDAAYPERGFAEGFKGDMEELLALRQQMMAGELHGDEALHAYRRACDIVTTASGPFAGVKGGVFLAHHNLLWQQAPSGVPAFPDPAPDEDVFPPAMSGAVEFLHQVHAGVHQDVAPLLSASGCNKLAVQRHLSSQRPYLGGRVLQDMLDLLPERGVDAEGCNEALLRSPDQTTYRSNDWRAIPFDQALAKAVAAHEGWQRGNPAETYYPADFRINYDAALKLATLAYIGLRREGSTPQEAVGLMVENALQLAEAGSRGTNDNNPARGFKPSELKQHFNELVISRRGDEIEAVRLQGSDFGQSAPHVAEESGHYAGYIRKRQRGGRCPARLRVSTSDGIEALTSQLRANGVEPGIHDKGKVHYGALTVATATIVGDAAGLFAQLERQSAWDWHDAPQYHVVQLQGT